MTRDEPPMMPYEFWTSPRFRSAFEARDMGKILRLFRTAEDHHDQFGPDGISQDLLAIWLRTTQTQISLLENGKSVVDSMSKMIRWAETLSIPNDLLWFDLTTTNRVPVDPKLDDEQGTPRRVGLAVARKAAGLSQEQLAERLHVDRSTIMRWESGQHVPQPYLWPKLAKVLEISRDRLAELLNKPAGPESGPIAEQSDRGYVNRRGFLGTSAGALLGFSAAMHPRLRFSVGESDIRYLLDRTARLRRLDNYLGGRDTYQTYLSELTSTVEYFAHSSSTADIRARLLGVISEQAQLAGWAAFDAGMHAEATGHYRRSLDAAKEAGDAALAGNALAFLAYQDVSASSPNIELAEASFATAEKHATPKVRALLLERKALTYASAKDGYATEKALSDARTALNTETTRAEPDWVFWVDENEIDIMSGRCWTELGQPSRAISVLDKALAKFDSTQARDKSLYSASLAHALIDNNEIERAAAVTIECIQLAEGVASVRPGMHIGSVVHRLRMHRALPRVAEVFEMAQN
ncbi:helix-turn-helix transcriptional regulator [Labedaea rhizosphaerae]|nr:helix-turn-helix transcriptional regulator [Labedaea rhizosphaerae]